MPRITFAVSKFEDASSKFDERKPRQYNAEFPPFKSASTVTKNRITCSARNPKIPTQLKDDYIQF